jgi:hypothetical protein
VVIWSVGAMAEVSDGLECRAEVQTWVRDGYGEIVK